MDVLTNSYRCVGLDHPALAAVPFPAHVVTPVTELLNRCPRHGVTPLVDAGGLADEAGIAALHIKDERERMGLGSFKALGAAYVIACDAAQGRAKGAIYVTASAGNHGLSVAAGAAAFGAEAVIFLAETVPDAFAERLRSHGATVMQHGALYEDSMAGAADYAAAQGAILLSDSSWTGYVDRPHRLMEGYLALMDEAVTQYGSAPPSHIFLQAGVGGLAGACAAHARARWGDAPTIVVVEPEAAPALTASIKTGAPVYAPGPVSAMGRLDCKEPSLIALKGLARDADLFMTLTEAEGHAGAEAARAAGLASTPSGAAGLAGVLCGGAGVGLSATSRALVILSEGPEA
ncbi:pyridoxal-phosphate dependent enzyme [Pseudaestuariivita sp.]|uniref:pyridoxal-phosphate dependent enzyme n=1 Tax=Pseudaestuariivita sp. TaxID=2211669 RepID=UPI0040599A2F